MLFIIVALSGSAVGAGDSGIIRSGTWDDNPCSTLGVMGDAAVAVAVPEFAVMDDATVARVVQNTLG